MTIQMFCMTLLAVTLTACGGSNGTEHVSYEGTTLVVEGVRYERPTNIYPCEGMSAELVCKTSSSRPSYLGKTVMLQMNTADEKAVIEILTRYGLSIIRRSELSAVANLPALTTLVIAVPLLFEEQWIQVFRNDSRIAGAWTNDLVYLTS